MSNSRFKFVIVSKDDSTCFKDDDFNCMQNVDVEYINNNIIGLPTLYNKAIDENKDFDFIVLMHADVWFDVKSFVMHVEAVKDKYDLIGLCGCDKISVS